MTNPHRRVVHSRYARAGDVERPEPVSNDGSDNPWFSSSGAIAHPDAPQGGGGAGGFRTSGPAADDHLEDWSPPHPHSPTGGATVLGERDEAAMLSNDADEKNYPPQKPPPATKTGTRTIKKLQDAHNDIDLVLETFADGTDSSVKGAAHTTMDPQGVDPVEPSVHFDGNDKVDQFGKLTIRGTITLQTVYKPGEVATGKSAYGRGTLEEDKKAGNTSIGFHENCHQQDAYVWVKTKPLPTFTGRLGMTETEWDEAWKKFKQAWDDYWVKSDDDSEKKTDEVGYTKSQYLRDNP